MVNHKPEERTEITRGSDTKAEVKTNERTRAAQVVVRKGYESSDDEHGIEDMILEGEQGQTHVGENEVLRQEIQQFKQLQHNKTQHLML